MYSHALPPYHRYAPTPALHTYPTRRSSDLSMRIENYLGFPTGVTGGELTDRAILQANKFGARISVPAPVTHLTFDKAYSDRKSTRLNSSHRCISYAVFCLKKKTLLISIISN